MLVALTIAALTVIYLILGRLGMAKLDKERKTLTVPDRPPLVSIIIPAYNSQETIEETLKSVKGLDYPRKEIIVVNDSRDNAPAIAKSYGARVIQNPTRIGKPESLNKATALARGELLFILDSDTTASKDSLQRMVPWFSKKEVFAVMPKYLLKKGSLISQLAALENLLTFALLRMNMFFGRLVGFRGCSVLIKKEVFKKHRWPNTLMEDNHLSANLASLGHRIIWEPLAITKTDEPHTTQGLKKQKRRWGEGAYLAFRCHWRFYLRSPQFILFFFPYLILGIITSLLSLSFIISPFLFPTLTISLLGELVFIFLAIYIHDLIFIYIAGGGFSPLKTLKFLLFYLPIMSYSYIRGLFSGIKRRRRGECELHFRHW
jgi:cellulose synthase/poly-beta-1,6-N-acetylglucosamine synthase-like glycosyltransferase